MIYIVFYLAFHDCVVRCDGCLNPSHPPNAGLGPFVDTMEEIFVVGNYRAEMGLSRADFWAIAGLAAVGRGIRKANRDKCQDG